MFSGSPRISMKHLHAFSLVELMVVIAIVAILSSVAVPSYRGYVVRSQVSSLLPLVDDLKSDVQQAHNDGVVFGTTGDEIRVAAAATDKPPFLYEFKRTDYGCIQITYDLDQMSLDSSGGKSLAFMVCPSVNGTGNIINWSCGYSSGSEPSYGAYLPPQCAQVVTQDTSF